MSVYLNSTPQEDGNLLNGSVVKTGPNPVYFAVAQRESSQATPTYLSFATGGQFVGVWDRVGTYLTSGDTGFTFRWKIWARGSGTFALTQDTDPMWDTSALPATSIGSLAVSAGSWTLYHVAAGTISLTDFLAYDGIRLGLDMTSGSADVITVQLECVPDSGTTGWWVNQLPDPVSGVSATSQGSHTDVGVIEIHSGADYGEAGEAALDATVAADILNTTGVDTTGPGTQVTARASSWYRQDHDVDDTPYGQTNMSAAFLSVKTEGATPTPDGTEGVDYIRIPEYTLYDTNNLMRSAANRDNPPYSYADWDTPYFVWQMDLTFGGDPALGNKIWVYLTDGYLDPTTTTTGFTPVGDPIKTITSSSDPLETESTSLPSNGFTIWILSAQLTTTVGGADGIVIYDPSIGTAEYMDGIVTVQSDPVGEANSHKPLTYTRYWDAISVWDPNASPGGKLKVRLPDNTWRIVGDESGSDTERLKLQTPDLTWWKEYRSSDGAVPVHPLKLYTAGGWVVTGMMTPE